MAVVVQRADERGDGSQGWLKSRFSFSFANWYHPQHVQWGALRVLNDDRIAPKSGFGFHRHSDMEIVTYVLAGAIHHKDSLGNDGAIHPGEAQRMSAGSGVVHSEWNHGDNETHMLQTWIVPARESLGMAPGYEQKRIPDGARETGWHPVAEGRLGHLAGPGTVRIHQDAAILATRITAAAPRPYAFAAGRLGNLFVAEGDALATVGTHTYPLETGASLRLRDESAVTLTTLGNAHVLMFDLPPDPPREAPRGPSR